MTPEERRKKANDKLIARMRKGKLPPVVSSEAIAFPPRPIIEKDKEAIEKIYGEKKPT